MENKEIRELLEAAQNGDNGALYELLEMFRPILVKYSIIDGRFDEDCFQELAVKFIECIKNFKFNGMIDIDKYLGSFNVKNTSHLPHNNRRNLRKENKFESNG